MIKRIHEMAGDTLVRVFMVSENGTSTGSSATSSSFGGIAWMDNMSPAHSACPADASSSASLHRRRLMLVMPCDFTFCLQQLLP